MDTDLDKLRAKLAALKAKTTAAGCTEAEALAAAEAVARLMAAHGLTDADIEMTAARAKEKTVSATWRTSLAASVGYVTSTAPILLPDDGAYEFVGREPWPEVAAYLYQVLVRSVERETATFKATSAYKRRRTTRTRRAAVADFVNAMVVRLRVRLLQLFRATLDAGARAAAKQALASRHPDSNTIQNVPGKPRFADAADAGWDAGNRVTLTHGVAGADGRPLAIGSD